MKILHLSDLHLGVSFKSLRGSGVGRYVNNHILHNIEEAFRYAVENSIDLVLLSGDLFNNMYSSYIYAHHLVSKLKILYDNRIPVVIIAGNHDTPKMRGFHTPLVVLSRIGIENVYYQEGLPNTPIHIESGGYSVGILPLPYIPISDPETARDRISDFIEMHLKHMKKVDIRLLIAHYDVSGSRYSIHDPYSNSYYRIMRIPSSSLKPEEFDYVALGHIHLHQRIKGYENMYYSGSIDRMTFGEAEEEKGFIVVEIERDKPLKTKFIPVSALKMIVTPKLDINSEEPLNSIINYFEEIDIEESLIRIRGKTSASGWRKLREGFSNLDRYLLAERKAVGYRVDLSIPEISGGVEVDRPRFERGDWLIVMIGKYIDSLTGIPPRDREEMKKYVKGIFREDR